MRYNPLKFPVRWRAYGTRRSTNCLNRLDDPKKFPNTIRLAYPTEIQRNNDNSRERMEVLITLVLFIGMLCISGLIVYGIHVKKSAQIEDE